MAFSQRKPLHSGGPCPKTPPGGDLAYEMPAPCFKAGLTLWSNFPSPFLCKVLPSINHLNRIPIFCLVYGEADLKHLVLRVPLESWLKRWGPGFVLIARWFTISRMSGDCKGYPTPGGRWSNESPWQPYRYDSKDLLAWIGAGNRCRSQGFEVEEIAAIEMDGCFSAWLVYLRVQITNVGNEISNLKPSVRVRETS